MPALSPRACTSALPKQMPTSSTVWCASMWRSPLACTLRSKRPCLPSASNFEYRIGTAPTGLRDFVGWVESLRGPPSAPELMVGLAKPRPTLQNRLQLREQLVDLRIGAHGDPQAIVTVVVHVANK